jgi:glycosyltransferase involved in cell wall biosynthesis
MSVISWFFIKIWYRINYFVRRKPVGSNEYWVSQVKKKSDFIIEKFKPDFIIGSYPPVAAFDLALWFSKKYEIPLIADFRDGFVYEALEADLVRNNRKLRLYEEIEHELLSRSLMVTVFSETHADYFRRKFPASRIEVLYNGFDYANEHVADLVPSKLTAVFEDPRIIVLFTGQLGFSEANTNIGVLCQGLFSAIQKGLDDKKIGFVFVGRYTNLEMDLLGSERLRDFVKVFPPIGRGAALRLQRMADVLLIITSGARGAVPGKLFEYVAAEREILVVGRHSECAEIVQKNHLGLSVESPQELAETLLALQERVCNRPSSRGHSARSLLFNRREQMLAIGEKLRDAVVKARLTSKRCSS